MTIVGKHWPPPVWFVNEGTPPPPADPVAVVSFGDVGGYFSGEFEKPPGLADDTEYLFVLCAGNFGAFAAAPTGWTEVNQVSDGRPVDATYAQVFIKAVTNAGDEPAVTVWDGGAFWFGQVTALSGVDLADPIPAGGTSSVGNWAAVEPMIVPEATVDRNNSAALMVGLDWNLGVWVGNIPAGWDQITDSAGNEFGNYSIESLTANIGATFPDDAERYAICLTVFQPYSS